ncbi:AraC family transcriptional regulator [Mucilaginibacter sp. BT774]|uniref:helix-turn-helix domain-containing protein n=1 Tax=Mucilaginibacter sp. BT774 TaxID=3062276 RepID=UPI002675BA56|nr:AraC family transcriptional regulator [Mucilaginibacter sp. BT774]MDO3628963.1 AraC family transcriptional regulator [Mucilaginibacter sp. BT774]
MSKRLLGHNFSLLHVDHVKLNEKWNYPNVISPYFRVYYIDQGEGFISTKQEKIKLEQGYLYVIPSFTLCHLSCNTYLSQYFLHFFEESAEGISIFENNRKVIKVAATETDIINFKKLLSINPGRGINRSDNPTVYEKNAYYKSYQEINNTVSDSVYFETQGIILQLISRFLNSHGFKNKSPDPVPSKILDAARYIQLNLKQNLTVNYLAGRANLHQDYFSRLFFKHTGQRPLNYLHEKRIERAQYLIATTTLSYREIAEKTGFENLPHFSKIFKKVTSLTPGEYKKLNGLL